MFFYPGSKVYLKHEDEWAVIQSLDDDGFMEVQYPSGLTCWIHSEDVLGEEEYLYFMAEENTVREVEEKALPSDQGNQRVLSPPGAALYLCLTSFGDQAIADEYQIWLINSTTYECEVEATLENLEGVMFSEKVLLELNTPYMLCELFKEDLSMQSRLDLHLTLNDGMHEVSKTLRYKFQPKKLLQIPSEISNGERRQWIELLAINELSTSTAPIVATKVKRTSLKQRSYVNVELNDVHRKAAFPLEIDLHAHKILKNPQDKPKHQIVKYQMSAFQNYLQEAIRLGIDRVFIIHGVGEGKLKERIHQELAVMPYIQSFCNDFHPRYGWGATEVVIA